jgi:beta-mannosidase
MSFTSGDVHYWGVWHGKEPFEEFAKKIGRFMSEYGFQSFPEFKTVQSYTLPEDYSIESEVMASHQRSGVGNMLIKKYMSYYYKTPKDFESFLYVSQVQQAEAIKSAIEAHRSKMPLCMGTLYWQINDCWPVASWSSIDYYNRWKALHYFARKAYQKFLICPRLENGKIIIYAVSDSLETVNAQLSIKLIDFTGKILNSLLSTVQAKANTSTKVFEMQQTDFLNGANPQNSLLYAELNLSGEKLSDNILYFEPSKNLSLINPDIKKNIEKSGNNYKITIESENLAKNVYLSIDEDDGFFSDNYFDIIPGREIIVIYSPIKPINNFEQKLKIITLTDSY